MIICVPLFCHVFVKQKSSLHVIAWKYIFASMAKRFINILLIIILSVQVLPIKQMGSALFSHVFNEEEVPDALEIEKDFGKKLQGKSEFIDWTNEPVLLATFIELQQPLMLDASIPTTTPTKFWCRRQIVDCILYLEAINFFIFIF